MKQYLLFSSFISLFVLVIIYFVNQTKVFEFHSLEATNSAKTNFDRTKIIASNQWFSSVYKYFPTQPLFAFPLAYKLSDKGIGLSYPSVAKVPDTIFGTYVEDISVGLKNNVTKPQIQKIGDWSIGLLMKDNDNNSLTFSLAQGIPWTVIYANNQKIVIRLQNSAKFYNHGKTPNNETIITTDSFRLFINNHNYIIVLPKDETIQISPKEISIPTDRIFVGLLSNPENFEIFRNHAAAEVSDTLVHWDIKNNVLFTTYQFLGNKTTPLVTVLPHQYDTLSKKPEILGTYETIRGKLRLIAASSFITEIPVLIPQTNFKPLQSNHPDFIEKVKDDQKKVIHDDQQTNGDYFLGTWYGKAGTILQLLDASGLQNEKRELFDFLKPKLIQSLQYFTYNKSVQSVIADKPEFGNEKLNDHHFHYGYYIRTAAILAGMDPSYTNKVQNKINELIEDIANTDRNSDSFPFLRNFNVYEGHSFADGFANFGDGNNQESSSEAINAWYSLYLWAQTTNNKNLEKTALYLYNTEILGTKYYWFGKNDIYTKPYDHAIGVIVWGGKVDFTTWFSNKTNMKYGIQILPITPGSLSYLGTFDNFSKYESDFYNHNGDVSDEWGDLFTIFTSFYNPEKAFTFKEKVMKPEANTPPSLFLYMLYHNKNL